MAHGAVVQVIKGSLLRLEAPFGPLQGMGAYVIWTIKIEPSGEGSIVTFDEVAMAPPGSSLEAVAPAGDGVKGEAMRQLVSEESGRP